MNLYQVAEEITRRLASIFLRDEQGRRPVLRRDAEKFQEDPHWRDLILFYEYFHGDNGAGLGASHQTGWTGVVARTMHLFATSTSEEFLNSARSPAPSRWSRRGAPPPAAGQLRGESAELSGPKPAVLLLTAVAVSGCASIGPATVTRDRFDYTGAVAESWKTQMLLNLVKLRYGDTPVFLDVGQIVSGYTVQSTFTAGGNIFSTSGVVPGVPNSSVTLGAQGQYTDRPTITYAPLSGERFARSLMTPIPPAALLSMIQAGNPVDLVLRLAVHVVNGIYNRYGGEARARPADPEFYVLLERLRRIQLSGAIGLRVRRVDREEAVLMTFRGKVDPSLEAEMLATRELLGLDPAAREFQVVYGSVPANDMQIAILSRSILEILVDLSSFIGVPEAHVTDRRVTPTAEPEVGPSGTIRPLIRIGSSPDRPADAFLAVPYRGHWFWIDDRDMGSKRLFSFLMFVFTLVETGGKESAPVLTIPTQ